ncbi:hypothetical protein WJX72_005938 [[Myrmecia] bisecta]|uniref:Cell division cycle protein 123 n=1 Tax=[Myrmecia] bisecta TaxID=41462 RepID=A0AAW1QR01_9CHLO
MLDRPGVQQSFRSFAFHCLTTYSEEMRKLRVTRVPESAIDFISRAQHNSNNHRAEDLGGREAPLTTAEYHAILAQTDYHVWAGLKLKAAQEEVSFTAQHARVFVEAARSAELTLRFPEAYADELEAVARECGLPWTEQIAGAPFFARFSSVSLKDGRGTGPDGNHGPFRTGKEIITAIVTSHRAMNQLRRKLKDPAVGFPTTLYLLLWQDSMFSGNEFRVFVYQRRITAVSQYDHLGDNGWGDCADSTLEAVVDNMQALLADILARSALLGVTLPDNFTMDILCLPQEQFKVEMIELNCFGAQLAAGSCLFHWVHDYDQLHSDGEDVELRVIGWGSGAASQASQQAHGALIRNLALETQDASD